MKKVIIPTILLLVFLITFFVIFLNDKGGNVLIEDSGIILFYSEYCGHCAIVKEYIEENKIEEKIKFETKDANKDTSLLFEKANICGITGNVGVPFLFDGESCVVGDKNIIDFFKERLK
ncbi:MAG: hypothetical protein WC909_02620 [Candidatus Paceibacterota bacterium]|jgi:glutaredoxin